jgi:hypothetical protein
MIAALATINCPEISWGSNSSSPPTLGRLEEPLSTFYDASTFGNLSNKESPKDKAAITDRNKDSAASHISTTHTAAQNLSNIKPPRKPMMKKRREFSVFRKDIRMGVRGDAPINKPRNTMPPKSNIAPPTRTSQRLPTGEVAAEIRERKALAALRSATESAATAAPKSTIVESVSKDARTEKVSTEKAQNVAREKFLEKKVVTATAGVKRSEPIAKPKKSSVSTTPGAKKLIASLNRASRPSGRFKCPRNDGVEKAEELERV